MALIQEINELRQELQTLRVQLHSQQLQSAVTARKKGRGRGSPADHHTGNAIKIVDLIGGVGGFGFSSRVGVRVSGLGLTR